MMTLAEFQTQLLTILTPPTPPHLHPRQSLPQIWPESPLDLPPPLHQHHTHLTPPRSTTQTQLGPATLTKKWCDREIQMRAPSLICFDSKSKMGPDWASLRPTAKASLSTWWGHAGGVAMALCIVWRGDNQGQDDSTQLVMNVLLIELF